MKTFKLFSPILFILLFISFQKGFADEILRIQVKETRASCMGVAPMECLQVKFKNSKDWELFYTDIKNFYYQKGFRYTLLVKKSEVKNAPADASAYQYELVKIIKKRKKKITKTISQQNPSPIEFLAKHKWSLIQLNGKLTENNSAFIGFDKEKNTVHGNTGCNNFFGGVKFENDKISFNKLGSTRMACDPKRNELERAFLMILNEKNLRFDIADQTFNIYNGNVLVMMFGMNNL